MLIDKCELVLKAGDGGKGVIAWRKEAKTPMGGPYGGNGGKGGDIYLLSDHNLNSLTDFQYKKEIKAQNGTDGSSGLCHGKNGDDLILKVPVGTVVVDCKTNKVLFDFLKTGQKFLICAGGVGGKGNFLFKSSFNRTPELCENGDLGEVKKIKLELKYIANVGFVGLPNAGKSTLLNALANTNLKTANYAFTTLNPHLGIVKRSDKKLVFVDLPGIIENASNGVGLGFSFLKHIERCEFLIHLISISPTDTNDPYKDYLTIHNELISYSKKLGRKKTYIVLNKLDDQEHKTNLSNFKKAFNKHHKNKKLYLISGKDKSGLDELLSDIFKEFAKYDIKKSKQLEKKLSAYSEVKVKKIKNDKVRYKKIDGIYHVDSEKITYWYYKIPLNTEQNTIRFYQKINLDEIEITLKKKGLKKGDSFKIKQLAFEID